MLSLRPLCESWKPLRIRCQRSPDVSNRIVSTEVDGLLTVSFRRVMLPCEGAVDLGGVRVVVVVPCVFGSGRVVCASAVSTGACGGGVNPRQALRARREKRSIKNCILMRMASIIK